MTRASVLLLLVAAACGQSVQPIEACPPNAVRVDGTCRVRCDDASDCLGGEICDLAVGACRRHSGSVAQLRFEPLGIDFGPLLIGDRNTRNLSLFADGADADDVTITLDGDPDLRLVDPPQAPFTLGAGLARPLEVTYTPSREGDARARIVATGCGGACTAMLTLAGTGQVPAQVFCQPDHVDFGDIDPAMPPRASVTCTNASADSLELQQIAGTPDVTVFTTAAGTIDAGDVFGFELVATGARAGIFQDDVEVQFVGGLVVRVPVTGRVVGTSLVCQPAQLDLGSPPARTVVNAPLVCTNLSSAPVQLVSAFLSPSIGGLSFTTSAQAGETIAPGSALQVSVTWRVTSNAALASTLHLTTDGDPVAVPITGNTPRCHLEAEPGGRFDFGISLPGRGHVAAVPVLNSGTQPCTITTQLSGPQAGEVSITDAPTTIDAGQRAWIELRWVPAAPALSARLGVVSRETAETLSIDLVGVAGTPPLYAPSEQLKWGPIPAGCQEGNRRLIELVNLTGSLVPLTTFELVQSVPAFELSLRGMPPSPGPGERLRIPVTATPPSDGPVRGRVRIVTASGVTQYIELNARATRTIMNASDTVPVPSVGAIDVLFVVDDDLLTGAVTQSLGAEAQRLFDNLPAGTDFHVGVVHAQPLMGSTRASLVGQPAVIVRGTPNPGMALGARIGSQGLAFTGSPLLAVAGEAVEGRRATTTNAGFLRPDGQLEVVVVSAREDASGGTVTAVLEALRERTIGRPRSVRVSAISGGAMGCRSQDRDGADPAPRLARAVALTGGLDLSACRDDQGNNLRDLAQLMVTAQPPVLQLQSQAVPGTITVERGGNEIEGWGLEPITQRLVFGPTGLIPSGNVVLTWRPWCVAATCGNGRPDPLDACDDGDGVDANACTNACQVAACGDGIYQPNVEQCDDANLDDEDECTRACEPPR